MTNTFLESVFYAMLLLAGHFSGMLSNRRMDQENQRDTPYVGLLGGVLRSLCVAFRSSSSSGGAGAGALGSWSCSIGSWSSWLLHSCFCLTGGNYKKVMVQKVVQMVVQFAPQFAPFWCKNLVQKLQFLHCEKSFCTDVLHQLFAPFM